MFPGLPEAGTNNLEETGDGVEEDGTATSVVKVEWIGKPTMAMEETSAKESLRGELGGTYHKPMSQTRRGDQSDCRVRKICRSKCPKNNFDRTTSPASSHRTYLSVASHTLGYSLVPSHEPIHSIVRTSYSSRAYANRIAGTRSSTSTPNIPRRTPVAHHMNTLVSPGGISHLFPGIN